MKTGILLKQGRVVILGDLPASLLLIQLMGLACQNQRGNNTMELHGVTIKLNQQTWYLEGSVGGSELGKWHQFPVLNYPRT